MPFTSADTEVGLILTPDRTQRSCINAASMAGLAALSRDLWVAGAVVWSGFALGKEAAQNSYFGSLLTSFSFRACLCPVQSRQTPRGQFGYKSARFVESFFWTRSDLRLSTPSACAAHAPLFGLLLCHPCLILPFAREATLDKRDSGRAFLRFTAFAASIIAIR